MRYALLPLLLLAACHRGGTGGAPTVDARGRPLPTIACTTGGEQGRCTVEKIAGPDGLVLLVRHPDGGFRRLAVASDGRGVVAADGAWPARVTVVGRDRIDVTIGPDRYRLPATVGG